MAIPDVDTKLGGYFNHSVMIGHDGTVFRLASVDSDGNLKTRNTIWNTSTLAWENATGSLAGGGTVTVNNFPATYPVTDNSGSLTVDAPVGTPVFVRLSDGSAAIATLPVSLASLPALAAGTNNIGDIDVLSIAAGTNTIGQVGVVPVTSGGLTIYRNLDLDETGISVKGSAGQVYGGFVYNANASIRYLKFYNKATAATVGTDVPVLTVPLPATSLAILGAFSGVVFGTGISVGATTGLADNDTGAPSANDVIVNLFYK